MLSSCQVRMRELSRPSGGLMCGTEPDLNPGLPMSKAGSNRPASGNEAGISAPTVRPQGEQGSGGHPSGPRRSSLPRVQNTTSNHRLKFERHVGHFPAREAQQQEGGQHGTQLPGRTLSSGCRRPQEQPPPLGNEARPNQRGRNMGLARGVDGPSLGLFSWGDILGGKGGPAAVQCSAAHLQWVVSPTCWKCKCEMHVRWVLGKQWGGENRHRSSISKKWVSGGGGAWPTWPHFAGRRREVKLHVGLACGRRLAVGVGRDMRGRNCWPVGWGLFWIASVVASLVESPGSWMTTWQHRGDGTGYRDGYKCGC